MMSATCSGRMRTPRRAWGSNAAPDREIRSRYASGGITQRRLGALYGVTNPTVCAIIRGLTWRHVS